MNSHVRNGGILAGIFSLSFSIALATQYKKPVNNSLEDLVVPTTPATPETDQQRVLNSLLDIKGFSVSGDMTMISKDNTKIGFGFSGKGDLSDLEDIKLSGNIDVNLNDSHLKANFAYFDSEIFFDYHESYFKLETEQILDFIKLLPTNYGANLSIPTEIENIDLGYIESYFEDMSDKQLTPDGNNYYFTINLGENGEVPLYVITDLDLNFAGIRTGNIDYQGMIFSLDVKLDKLASVDLVNPKDTPEYAKYQDFSPAFKLFDGFYALTKKKQNTISADLSVRKYETKDDIKTTKNILKTQLDVTYDLTSENHLYAIDGKVIGQKKDSEGLLKVVEVPYSFALYNKAIYAHYGDIALSIRMDSLNVMIDYIMQKIGDDKISELLDTFTGTMTTSQITDIAAKANDLLGSITLTSDELGIGLNTSNFSTTEIDEKTGEEVDKLKLTDLYVTISFDPNSGELQSIKMMNFGINDYEADLIITFGEYKPFSLDAVNYQEVDHLISVAGIISELAEQNQFRIEFDAKVSKDSEEDELGNTINYNDILIDGGLQFEIDPERKKEGHVNVGYGYGDLSITDRKNVKHNIKADMKSVDELLLSYSTVIGDAQRDASVDPMNVKMKVQTMKDLVDVVTELIKNPDDHFNELMGSLLNKTASLPIEDIIGGDYLQLLTTNIINRFEVGPDYIEIDIALDVLAFEGTDFTVRIEFDSNGECVTALKALKISGLEFEGLNIEFNAYLKDFKPELESSRLSPAEDYIDFSDLKVLLQLGINTSKNNYYHFTATAKVTLSLLDITIDLPLDIKVWTNKGDVKVSVDIDVPVIALVNPAKQGLGASDRKAHIYYHDKVFYVQRTEKVTKSIFHPFTKCLVEQASKYEVKDFFDNVLSILCEDVLCLSNLINNKIKDAVNKTDTENYQMKYENILNDFVYSKSGHYFFFDINLAELANNEQLTGLTVKVYTDDSDTVLTGLNANLTIKLNSVISFVISLDLTLADSSLVADESNNLVALDVFEARMKNVAFGHNADTMTDL